MSVKGALWLGDTETGARTRLTNGTTTLMYPLVGPGDRVAMTEAIEDFDVVELLLSGGAPRTLVNSSRYDAVRRGRRRETPWPTSSTGARATRSGRGQRMDSPNAGSLLRVISPIRRPMACARWRSRPMASG
jgi:hypothetical protein